MSTASEPSKAAGGLGRAEILNVAGDIDDAKVAAIEASGATLGQLEEAVAWASAESDVMGQARRPLSGIVAEIYEILTSDEAYRDERD